MIGLLLNRHVWAAAGAVALVIAAWVYIGYIKAGARAEGRAEVQALWDADRARTAQAAIAAAAANSAETQRRLAAQKDADDQHTQALALARSDALAAADALRRLRDRATATFAGSSRSASDSAATAVSPAASASGDLYRGLFERVAEAAGQFSEYADTARAAGDDCAARYDALTQP